MSQSSHYVLIRTLMFIFLMRQLWNDWAGLSVSKQGSEIGRNAGRTRDRDTGIAWQSKRYNKRGGDRHCGVITDVKRE